YIESQLGPALERPAETDRLIGVKRKRRQQQVRSIDEASADATVQLCARADQERRVQRCETLIQKGEVQNGKIALLAGCDDAADLVSENPVAPPLRDQQIGLDLES